mmetsp:Transcript_24959/g.54274  ORF Transcript_24959/g.54274 Transcript_24959/m.54274 type:complete len:91 (-) Transcript_24959:2051-2323(-)
MHHGITCFTTCMWTTPHTDKVRKVMMSNEMPTSKQHQNHRMSCLLPAHELSYNSFSVVLLNSFLVLHAGAKCCISVMSGPQPHAAYDRGY